MSLTEWAVQSALTRQWVDGGIVIDGEPHLLAAWEVMFPSWRVNDASRHWTEPSIDFVAIDRQGRLVAIELKRSLSGVKPAWRVLCQVTHRALVLARSFSSQKLDAAHRACWSGEHGRVRNLPRVSLVERHRMFYGLERPVVLGRPGTGRVVAAGAFGPSWPKVRSEFESLPSERLLERLREVGELGERASPKAREAERLSQASPWDTAELTPFVASMEVDWQN